MGLFELQSIEWTPAACYMAFSASLMVLTALTLLSGKTDDFYKFEPHTKKISSRQYELGLGANLLGWAAGMIGALVAGGAHVMCILQLLPMLAATYYHYASGGKTNVIINCPFMVAAAYCGFMPMPTFPSIEWTPAACFLAFQASLVVLTALTFLSGKTDDFYKQAPHVKEMMSRLGELQTGSCLLGFGLGLVVALIFGGAEDMCMLELPTLLLATYQHYEHYAHGGKTNTIVNCVFMVPVAYFGFVRRLCVVSLYIIRIWLQ